MPPFTVIWEHDEYGEDPRNLIVQWCSATEMTDGSRNIHRFKIDYGGIGFNIYVARPFGVRGTCWEGAIGLSQMNMWDLCEMLELYNRKISEMARLFNGTPTERLAKVTQEFS